MTAGGGELCMCTHVNARNPVQYTPACVHECFSGVNIDVRALVHVCACVSMGEYVFHLKPDIALFNRKNN